MTKARSVVIKSKERQTVSIFDGIADCVAAICRSNGLIWQGGYESRSFYDEFRKKLDKDQDAGIQLVEGVLKGVLGKIESNARNALEGNGSSLGKCRGALRRALDVSRKRQLRNIEKGEDWEVTLERTIVSLKADDKLYKWFNQFNVASGVCGATADKKVAIDIVRTSRSDPSDVEFIELKEWNSTNHPFYASLEVFRYFCVYYVLSFLELDQANNRWPRFEKVCLSIIAPEQWYQSFTDAASSVDAVLLAFAQALERMQESFDAKMVGKNIKVSFRPKGWRLSDCSREEFRGHFNGLGQRHASQINEVLKPEGVPILTGWVHRAFGA